MPEMPFDFNSFELSEPFLRNAILTVVTLLVAFVLTKVGQRLTVRYLEEPERRYRTSKAIGRTAALLTILLLIGIWTPRPEAFLTILTIVGAGLAIAMREALLSLVGWVILFVRSPYRHGDRIEVNGIRGDVIDVRLLHTTLMEVGGWVGADQSTGRLVDFPNAWIFLHGVYNYTRGFSFIWNELSITVTFRSDWEAARDLMLARAEETSTIVAQQAKRQIRRMSRDYLVHYGILTPFVYVQITERGIRLTLRYLCEVRKRRGTAHALTLGLLEDFQRHGGIELAYPMTGVSVLDGTQFGGESGPEVPAGGNGTRAQPPLGS